MATARALVEQPAALARCFAAPRGARAPRRLVCVRAAHPEQQRQDRVLRVGTALLAGAAAAALALSPLPADAVSGGGGLSNALNFGDLSNQDLTKRRFVKADLRGTNFSGSNMRGVSLFGAILVDTKFVDADLSGADLESSDLDGSDLTNALLEGAMLSNAQLRNLKSIEGADFTDALIRRDVQLSLCKIASGTNPKTGVATSDSLGCP